jgi:hypothetical protein
MARVYRLPTKKLPVSKPAVFPKTKAPVVKVPPILSPEQSLKQFSTKPVVTPLGKVKTKAITNPLKSYLP